MSTPKAPAAPDYLGVAREQGQQNLEAARVQAQLNRVNQVGPGGNVSYQQDPNNPDVWTQRTTLDAENQQLYNQDIGNRNLRQSIARQNLQNNGQDIGTGINTNGLPKRMYGASPTDQASTVNAGSVRYGDINTGGIGGFESGGPAAGYQRGVNFNGATALPGNNDFSGERQRVEDALYTRGASRLDDQFGRQQEDMRSQLLNRGLREGTAAYEDSMRDFNQSKTDAYGDLRDRAVSAGGAEQSRLFSQALAARQQGVGETVQQGDFANNAAQLQNMYGLDRRQQAAAERGQQFGENESVAQFGNQAAQQKFTNELARGGFQNEAQQQEFMQRLANAQLNNQGRDAAINEQLVDQDKQTRGLQFLYSGAGADIPGAPAPGSSGNVNPADIFGATQAQYGANFGQYQSQAQQAQQQQQLLATLAAAGIFASDRRLKTDIQREGETPSGLGIYSYRYRTGGERQLGTMSDDVRALYPDAVLTDERGYDMVDYGKVTSRELDLEIA